MVKEGSSAIIGITETSLPILKSLFFSVCTVASLFYFFFHSFLCVLLWLGLVDEQQKVRTITALALAALAEAATPYGIESFDSVLKPLWKGIRQHRGKVSRLDSLGRRFAS